MHFSDQLAERLNSDDASRESLALRLSVAIRHKNSPVLVALKEALDRPEVVKAEQVIDVVRPLMDDPSWALDIVQDYIEAQTKDRYFIPPVAYLQSDVFAGLQLFFHPKVRLTLSSSDIYQLGAKKASADGSGSIGLTGHFTILKFIKVGDARISLWSARDPDPSGAFGKGSSIGRTGERDLKDGDILVLDGRKDSFVIERARRSMVVLQATVMIDRAPLMVYFSAAERTFITRSASDVSSSRVQMLSTMLRTMGRQDALDAMRPFFIGSDFFVRWHVMREALALNAGAVENDLATMASEDPDHHVRDLAARTSRQLQMLSEAAAEET